MIQRVQIDDVDFDKANNETFEQPEDVQMKKIHKVFTGETDDKLDFEEDQMLKGSIRVDDDDETPDHLRKLAQGSVSNRDRQNTVMEHKSADKLHNEVEVDNTSESMVRIPNAEDPSLQNNVPKVFDEVTESQESSVMVKVQSSHRRQNTEMGFANDELTSQGTMMKKYDDLTSQGTMMKKNDDLTSQGSYLVKAGEDSKGKNNVVSE